MKTLKNLILVSSIVLPLATSNPFDLNYKISTELKTKEFTSRESEGSWDIPKRQDYLTQLDSLSSNQKELI